MIIIFSYHKLQKIPAKREFFDDPLPFETKLPKKCQHYIVLTLSWVVIALEGDGQFRKVSRPPKPANSANALTIPRAYWSPFGTSGSVMANMMPRPCSMQPSRDTSASGSSPHQFVTREAKLTLIHASQISRSSGPLDLETHVGSNIPICPSISYKGGKLPVASGDFPVLFFDHRTI